MELHELRDFAENAVTAQRAMLRFSSRRKRDMLTSIADHLEQNREEILKMNADDVADAAMRGRSVAYLDRLTITDYRFSNIVRAFRVIADSTDPIGEQVSRWIRPNGLEIIRKRVPMGVVGLVIESRPHVLALAAAVCLKVNNALLVVSDDEASRTLSILVRTIREGGQEFDLPTEAIQAICSDDNRRDGRALTSLIGLVDVAILRGSQTFVDELVAHAKIPVLKHNGGYCHVYVDGHDASLFDETTDELQQQREIDEQVQKAVAIVINSCSYEPYACNAAMRVLVHAASAEHFLPVLLKQAAEEDITIHGDARTVAFMPEISPIDSNDTVGWRKEVVLIVQIVDSIDQAIEHINRHGSHLADSIVSEDEANQERFLAEVDSAAVYVNASTCFTDGGEYGMGAEIGLSTDKLNARGPIGLEDLTSFKYMVLGDGQTR